MAETYDPIIIIFKYLVIIVFKAGDPLTEVIFQKGPGKKIKANDK